MNGDFWLRLPAEQRRLSRRAALRGGALGVVGLGAAFLAACGGDSKSSSTTTGPSGTSASGTQAAAIKRGGRLKISTADFFSNFDPTYVSDYLDLFLTFEPLLGLDREGKPGITDLSLASAFEQPDVNTLVFQLRKGVKFHDNSDFTAQAVKFTLDRAVADNPPGQVWKSTLANYSRTEAVDGNTARITLKKPDGSTTTLLADVAGMMLSPTTYADKPLEAVAWAAAGTGPYRLVDHRQDSFRRWDRFPDYWRKLSDGGTAALLDGFQSDEIPDPTVRTASIQSGELDLLVSNSPDPAPADLDTNPNLKLSRREGYGLQVLLLNHALPPLDNVDFRRGLAWAIDRAALSKSLYQGVFDGNVRSFLSPASWAFKETKDAPGFDVQKAKMFIDRSGVPEADRKVLLTFSSTAANNSQSFAVFQSMFAKVGVQAVYVDVAQAKGRVYKTRGEKADIHLVHFNQLNKIDPHLLVGPYLSAGGFFNMGGVALPTVDDLIDRATSTYDINQRKALYGQIQDLQADQMGYMIPLAVRPARQWAKKNVVGTDFRPGSGWPYFNNVGVA